MEEDYFVRRLNLWNGEQPKSDILYITRDKICKNITFTKGLFICVGEEDMAILSVPFSIILVSGVKEGNFDNDIQFDLFSSVFNTLQYITEKYGNWQKKTEELVYKHSVFFDVLDLLENELSLISLMEDKDLHFVSMSEQYPAVARWFRKGENSLPNDMLNDLKLDEEFNHAVNHDNGFLYFYDNVYTYCYNIKIGGEYKARFMINQLNCEPFFGGIAIVEYVGKQLTKLLEYYDTHEGRGIFLSSFYQTIQKLINNVSVTDTELTQNLRIKGWTANHQYQVYLFDFISKESMNVRKYYEHQIEKLFGNCCVLSLDGEVCCVQNQSLYPQNEKFSQNLATFLRENLCKVGSSQTFSDLNLLNQYYIEANQALILGGQSDSTQWHFNFQDMVLPYICSQAVQQLSPKILAHPAYQILENYDKENHTDMLYTLYEYMHHQFRATRTSECLRIHRTTLTFRIERIEKLTGIDWGNFDEMLHLGLTFRMLKYVPKEKY